MTEMILISALAFSNFKVSLFPRPPCSDPVQEVTRFTTVGENIHILFQERSEAIKA